jgi:hypothetical protein
MRSKQRSLAVVVPVGPGETGLNSLLGHLRDGGFGNEVVLSASGPVDIPQRLLADVRILSGPAGRAAQLNRGARATDASCLWFLHADSSPTPAAIEAATDFARHPARAIGWFDLAFRRDGPALTRLNAIGANLRSRWFGLPFGDQGLVVPRAAFERIGGFDESFGRGEDLAFVVSARAAGFAPRRLGVKLATSARRYRETGWARTTLAHAWLTVRLWRRARSGSGTGFT